MVVWLCWLVVVYGAITLFGYVVHRALHQPWMGRFNKSHLSHHTRMYPPTDYQSTKYRSAGSDNTVLLFIPPSLIMLAIPVVLGCLGVVSWWLMGTMLVEMLLIGWVFDLTHDLMHIEGHWLNSLPRFREWNARHYLHHCDMQSNLTMFDSTWDKVFGTYKDNTGEQR
jgi:sterol desaturase/sphingolipid hydroxylase (fatty acid hydroxylase superfamily)